MLMLFFILWAECAKVTRVSAVFSNNILMKRLLLRRFRRRWENENKKRWKKRKTSPRLCRSLFYVFLLPAARCVTLTGLSKGVGFIRFDQRVEAERAIQELNGTIPKGSAEPITVKFANNPSNNNKAIPPIAAYLTPQASRRFGGPIHHPTGRFRYIPLSPLSRYLLASTRSTQKDLAPRRIDRSFFLHLTFIGFLCSSYSFRVAACYRLFRVVGQKVHVKLLIVILVETFKLNSPAFHFGLFLYNSHVRELKTRQKCQRSWKLSQLMKSFH